MSELFSKRLEKFLILFIAIWVLYRAIVEFYNIAWGTGVWFGQFSLKWTLAFFLFGLFCIFCLIGLRISLWMPQILDGIFQRLSRFRNSLGPLRWFVALIFLVTPVYVLQYTFWGIVLHGPYIRIFMVAVLVILLGWLFTSTDNRYLSWSGALSALVMIFGICVFFVPLILVTNYPFSLGWSEGNRLWDYSIMFGRRLYDYPADKPIPVYLDVGRQFVGAIPFLIHGLTIWQERLWLALVDIIPYLILGWIAYWRPGKDKLPWILAGIWAFTFVRQGPIHPPLLLCAITVAIAWGRPLWLALPLILGASFFAEFSRFTWLFAPGMWAVMLELGGHTTFANEMDKRIWERAISLGAAGIVGGYVVPFVFPLAVQWVKRIGFQTAEIGTSGVSGVTLTSVGTSISSQPLLWYRLLPNETYQIGVLIGLILATAPLIVILIYLSKTHRWILNCWQKLAIVLPLLAFLVVGLIVSAKIGGGGDLHNLDMFIIGLMFTGAIAWRNGGFQWICDINKMSTWMRLIVTALVVLPGYGALLSLRPISISGDIRMIASLADIPLSNPLADTLPSKEDVNEELNGLRAEVERAAPLGEILFMDQRQLLTFGYVTGVPLVPEYDKKILIDKALSQDAQYFEGFYRDLAAHRFSLIISNPLREQIKTEEAEFGEENNAWVKWVSAPILCYYEPLYTLRKTHIQILGPRPDSSNCAQIFP